MTNALVFIIFAFGVGGILLNSSLQAARAERDSYRFARDSLELQADSAWSVANGWSVTVGTESPENLLDSLASVDSVRARRLSESNVRVTRLTRVVSVLRDSLQSMGQVVQPAQDSTGAISGAWAGRFADDLFSATWSFRLPEMRMGLVVEAAQCPMVLVATEAGDRTQVSAVGRDPRCTPDVEQVFIDRLPPQVVVRNPSFFSRLQRAVIWSSAGYLLGRVSP